MYQATAIASIVNLIGLGLYYPKTSMNLAYSISVYLRRNRVLMPSELSESPDQAGSIRLSPVVGPYAISSVL